MEPAGTVVPLTHRARAVRPAAKAALLLLVAADNSLWLVASAWHTGNFISCEGGDCTHATRCRVL